MAITRRIFIFSSVSAACFPLMACSSTSVPPDTSYRKISDTPVSDVKVLNFFSYACGHCLNFHDTYTPFALELKKAGVTVEDIPVMLDASHVLLSLSYYAFEALGVLDKVHRPFWEWFIYEPHEWKTVDQVDTDIKKWITSHGIALADWEKVFGTQDQIKKVERAQTLASSFKLDGTPALGVNGMYLTSPAMANSSQACLDVIKYLLKR